jgi:spermidine synthase
MLILIFGSTTFAISTVLTAFMGGLALGSYIFGRLIDRSRHPVPIYGILEAGIGVYAVLVPTIFPI